MRYPRGVRLVLAVLVSTPALAFDYRSFSEPAVMYDAPSQKANPLFVVARATPVEVVVTLEPWVKVRDAAGDMTWVEKRVLSANRTVVVTAPQAEVRAAPEVGAGLVFTAEKDVVLELIESGSAGWVKVRHRDGQSGFVRVNQVWGA